jgi:hypothetical protein
LKGYLATHSKRLEKDITFSKIVGGVIPTVLQHLLLVVIRVNSLKTVALKKFGDTVEPHYNGLVGAKGCPF